MGPEQHMESINNNEALTAMTLWWSKHQYSRAQRRGNEGGSCFSIRSRSSAPTTDFLPQAISYCYFINTQIQNQQNKANTCWANVVSVADKCKNKWLQRRYTIQAITELCTRCKMKYDDNKNPEGLENEGLEGGFFCSICGVVNMPQKIKK